MTAQTFYNDPSQERERKVEYDLTRLGSRQFEHVCRSLFQKWLGPNVSQFGDGADGGREASFTGQLNWQHGAETKEWDGYTVLQAKFLQRPLGTTLDQGWLIKQVTREIGEWANPKKKRRTEGRVPDFLIIASNVVLSPTAGGGADALESALAKLCPAAGVKDWIVWHHDTIASLLDNSGDIRKAYAGLITPGDVLAHLTEMLQGSASNAGEALRLHAAKGVVNEQYVRLTESGGTGRLTLEQVGVDLPAIFTNSPEERSQKVVAEIVKHGDNVLGHGIAPHGTKNKFVILGGPGQGKTTVSTLLAQTYRAALLGDDPDRHGHAAATAIRGTLDLLDRQQIPVPSNKRWPIRINLPAYADEVGGTVEAIVPWVARKMREQGSTEIDGATLRAWFQSWPWMVILDGLDEVASSSARDLVIGQITNFFIEVDTHGADVLTVITSRPQGYAHDFNGPDVEQVELKQLSTDEALEFAAVFADKHFEDDEEQRLKVLGRLESAANTPATARLMETPLQVTIMTLLLEGRERPPHTRHKLFDGYFETIYRREANKPGPVGQLLERHRRDIEAVHASAGLALQMMAESRDSSDAELSYDELFDLWLRRLESAGHDAHEAKRLAERMMSAAMNRLVLLVPKREGYGFEVRSLQEFMAALGLHAGTEQSILSRLSLLATSSHWRNTWLLATARLVENREHLHGDVLTLLGELQGNPLAKRLAIACELAYGLLNDQVAYESPAFRAQLLNILLDYLNYPPGSPEPALVLHGLARERPVLSSTIRASLKRAASGDEGCQATAWLTLTQLQQLTGPLPTAASQIRTGLRPDDDQIKAIQSWTGRTEDLAFEDADWKTLAEFVEEVILGSIDGQHAQSDVETFLESLRLRSIPMVSTERNIAMSWPLSGPGGPVEIPYPASDSLRDAVAIALDEIPTSAWAAEATIRHLLKNGMLRRAVSSELAKTLN